MWGHYGANGWGNRRKRIVGHVVAAASAVLVAGSTTSVAATAALATPTALPAGQQGSAASIPWSEVGPGWMLSEWSPKARNSPITLFLVDPLGGRYAVTTGTATPGGTLVGWSGDGKRALFEGSAGPNTNVTVFQLQTGRSGTFSVGSGDEGEAAFTQPDGLSIIVGGTASGTLTANPVYTPLRRFGLQGALAYTYPESFPQAGHVLGDYLYSPDGTELVIDTARGFEVVTNEGRPVRYIPLSPQTCQPEKWWAAGVVLASCTAPNSGISLLWLVPTNGARATQLTKTPLKGSGDYGDLDAWSLPSGDYVQDAGACGYIYLAKLGPTGRTTAVKVPGAVGSVFVQGAYGDQLALTTQFACQPGSTSLFWFNGATRAITPLLGPHANSGSVVGPVILFGTA